MPARQDHIAHCFLHAQDMPRSVLAHNFNRTLAVLDHFQLRFGQIKNLPLTKDLIPLFNFYAATAN